MLSLGKTFTRNYNLRFPFLDGFYDVGIFFSNKSPFLLFSILGDFSTSKSKELSKSTKINMFKNIETSEFCTAFLELHNYRSNNLDIVNQFKDIKVEHTDDVIFIANENIILSKHNLQDNVIYDQVIIYGLSIPAYQNEFVYVLAERQNIVPRLKRKIVRTSAIQIATSSALTAINEYQRLDENKESMVEDIKIKRVVNEDF